MAKSLMPNLQTIARNAMDKETGGYASADNRKGRKEKRQAKKASRTAARQVKRDARSKAKEAKDKAEEKSKSPSVFAGRQQIGDESRGSSRGGVGRRAGTRGSFRPAPERPAGRTAGTRVSPRTGPGRGDTVTRPGG